ncbi:Pericentrin [Schistosoma japonicum]|nr:Pericentrin [Schistosoma japonicum]
MCITELVLSKRLLEAQMNELRNSRDTELAEAKERVRAAERAVIAATRSVSSRKSVNEKDNPARPIELGNHSQQNANSNHTQPFMSLTFKKPLQTRNSINIQKNHSRSYTTLTAFSYDDFDSLDEDTDDETNENSCETIPIVISAKNNLDHLAGNRKSDEGMKKEIPNSANSDAIIQSSHECFIESSMDGSVLPKDVSSVLSPSSPSFGTLFTLSYSVFCLHTETNTIHHENEYIAEVLHSVSPTLSSTPRKSLPNETVVTPFTSDANISDFTNDVLGWNSDMKDTPYIKQGEANDVVSKVDYLRLLDEMEELRHDDEKLCHPGLTTQLLELKDEVASTSDERSSQTPSSLLPILPPGSTRLYDWSLSKSDLQVETEMNTNKSGDSETSTDEPTPVKTAFSPCDHCVELQAKIVTYEAIYAAQEDFFTQKFAEQSGLNAEAGVRLNKTLQIDNTTDNHKFYNVSPPTLDTSSAMFTCINVMLDFTCNLHIKNVLHSVCLQTEPDATVINDDQMKNFTICLEFYHKMILSIIDVSTKLKHELTTHVSDQYSLMKNNLSLDYNAKHNEQETEDHLMIVFGQLLPEIDHLLTLCKLGREQIILSTRSNQIDDDIENCELVRNLREQLLTAHQMLTEKLPVDTKNETSQLVETERIQLQAEMDRRISEFERNHTASLVELETSRHALMKQLDEMRLTNGELKNEIFSIHQKLQAKEKFLNEQIEERELEREEFRIELNRLKSELEMKKSQMVSYKLMNSSNTNPCVTPLNMKEIGQHNFISHWISDMKVDQLCQNESIIKSDIQTFINSKPFDNTWSKPNDHSNMDMLDAMMSNTRATQNHIKYVDEQNDWQPYSIPTVNNNTLDSVTCTSENYTIQNNSNEVCLKQMKLIDDSNAYIQQDLSLCDACTQAEVIKFDKSIEVAINPENTEVQVITDHNEDAENSKMMSSFEQLNLAQSSSNNDTNNWHPTSNCNQSTRTTKTTRFRTLNTTSAAALVSHVVVKEEEESVVTVFDEPEPSDSAVSDNQKFYQDQIEKCHLEIKNLRKQLCRMNTCQQEMEQTKLLEELMQHKQDKGVQTIMFNLDLRNDIRLKTPLTQQTSSSTHRLHHRSLPALFSPSLFSNNEDTGVEMSQGLLDLESIESITPPTAKSLDVENLILMKHEKCSSPEDENLQTLMGSPMSDKDDELENEISEMMLSSIEQLDTTPNSNVPRNTSCKPINSVNADLQTEHALTNNNAENQGTMVAFYVYYIPIQYVYLFTTASLDIISNLLINFVCHIQQILQVALSEVSTLIEQLMDSEVLIKTLRNEISDLTKYQIELQHDYDAVHEMLVERQNDLTRVTDQLLESENKCKSLSNQLSERKDKSLESKILQLELEIEELKSKVKCIDVDMGMSSVSVQTDPPISKSLFLTKMVQTTDMVQVSYFVPVKFIPTRFQTTKIDALTNRLKEESVRLATATEIATARQSICDRPAGSIAINKPTDSEKATINLEYDECVVPWISEIRNSYGDLKAAISEVTRTIHDNPWIDQEQSTIEDNEETMKLFLNRLLVSVTKALDFDEKLWLSAIICSVNQTYDLIRNRATPLHTNLVSELPIENILCKIIQQLTERISAFMRREVEFRKCLIEILHVEEASFKSELKTHVSRSDMLMGEMNRLTKVVSSLSEELDHANSRSNEIQNQLGDLQVELTHTQHELQSKENEVQRQRTDIEQLRSQLSKENVQTEKFRAELEALQLSKVQVEHELSSSNNLVQELKTSLANEKNRTQSLKIELDQLYGEIKKNTYHTILPPNNNNSDIGENITTKENKAPNDCSSVPNQRFYEVISLATVHLASTRRDTIKLHNQVKELQATANGLRLNLAEAELRLMPTLTSVLPDVYNRSNINNHSQSSLTKHSSASKKKSPVYGNQSELTSSRFTKLKNVCTDLLARVSMDEHDDDLHASANDDHSSNSHSSDDDSIADNIFIGSGIINSGGHRVDAERDECSSRDGGILRNKVSCRSLNPTNIQNSISNKSVHSASGNHLDTVNLSVNVTSSNQLYCPTQTLPNMTTSVVSSPNAHIDQVVSIERYVSLYARCLRAESYRRALSFQKRYLLLLLGNFEFSEDVVVANIGCPEFRFTSQVGSEDSFSSRINSNPLRRFRTIGRVIQVIHRMKHLVNKWRRVGIPSMQSTPFSNTSSFMNTTDPTSYNTPLQHRSFTSTSHRANQTSRIHNGSLRTPLKELHSEESNKLSSLSGLRNSYTFKGNQYSSNPVYTPRISQIQTSSSGYSSLLENQIMSTGSSYRWYAVFS